MATRRLEDAPVVRRARREDLPGALDVYVEVAAEGMWIGAELPIDGDRRIERWARLLDSDREAMFVAEAGGRIVGTATMDWVGASELGMAILSGFRRRGIGGALVTTCIEWARATKIHKIELRVWPHNAAAIALYEKHGFEHEGYLKRHYRRRNGELWDCIIMGLQLPDVPGAVND